MVGGVFWFWGSQCAHKLVTPPRHVLFIRMRILLNLPRVHFAHAHSVHVPRASLASFFWLRSMMASGNPPGTRTNRNSIQATRDYLQQAMVQLDRADPSEFLISLCTCIKVMLKIMCLRLHDSLAGQPLHKRD